MTHNWKGERVHSIRLADTLRRRMWDHLQSTYPNEGGGFLLGRSSADQIEIVEVRPIENTFATEEQFHRYAMTPLDWARMEDEADAQGLTVVGYYHSHPDHPAIPSEYDRVHALPNFQYLITSVQQGEAVDLKAWQLSADRSAFDAIEWMG